MDIQINPDWTRRLSKEKIWFELKLLLSEDGWYNTETDSLLILKDDGRGEENDMYWCYCWNSPSIREMLKQVHDLPVHIDTRG